MSKSNSTSMTQGAAGKSSQQKKTMGGHKMGGNKKSTAGEHITKRNFSSGSFVSQPGSPARKAVAVKPAPVSNITVTTDGTFQGVTQEHLDLAIAKVRRMTKAERIQSLIDCGILTPAGKLADYYRG